MHGCYNIILLSAHEKQISYSLTLREMTWVTSFSVSKFTCVVQHVFLLNLFMSSFFLFLSVHGLSPVLLLPVHVPGGEPSHSQLRESGRQQGECHCRLKISIVYLHFVNFGFKEHQPPLLIILSFVLGFSWQPLLVKKHLFYIMLPSLTPPWLFFATKGD